MFRFSVDSRHMSEINGDELKKAGIIRDYKFQAEILQRAVSRYHEIDIPSDMVDSIVEEIFNGEIFLRAKKVSPTNRRDAFNYLARFFGHPPKRMWINGEYIELTCTGKKLMTLIS